MLKIVRDNWPRNEKKLENAIRNLDHFPNGYSELVKMAFNTILNDEWDPDHIHEIDDGDWQGTLIYLIPFRTYQPFEYEYLMTYIYYGSCSWCDTLQGIERLGSYGDPVNNRQAKELVSLCRDILMNTIRPYNSGWRHDPEYDQVEMEESADA